LTRLRVTAFPTAFDTTKPALVGEADAVGRSAGEAGMTMASTGEPGCSDDAIDWSFDVDCSVGTVRCTTTAPLPERRPARTAAEKSTLLLSRCAAGSMG
jgi:hypothetical protein